jgi:hypothetical protein
LSAIRTDVTNFAKELYPDDPLKIDYPFVLLGMTVKGKPFTRSVLKNELDLLLKNPYNIFPASDVQTKGENDIIRELEKNNVNFYFEPAEYHLPPECWSKQYLPDFILPDTFVNGKRVLIECHGIWSILPGKLNTIGNEDFFINKMRFFSNARARS